MSRYTQSISKLPRTFTVKAVRPSKRSKRIVGYAIFRGRGVQAVQLRFRYHGLFGKRADAERVAYWLRHS